MKELQNIETGLSKNTQEENIEENLKQVTDPTDVSKQGFLHCAKIILLVSILEYIFTKLVQ